MENKNKYNNSKQKNAVSGSSFGSSRTGAKQPFGKDKFGMWKQGGQSRSRVLSLTQLLSRIRKQRGGTAADTQPLVSNFVKNTGTNSLQANDLTLMSAGGKNNRSLPSGKGGAFFPLTLPGGVASQGNKRSDDQQTALLSNIASTSNTISGVNLPGGNLKNSRDQKTRNLLQGKQTQLSQKDQMSISSFNPNLSRGTRMEREEQKRQKPIKPIIPPKSLVIILKEKPEKILYNRRIIDYKHCGLLQRYIGLGGKILPRRQTRLTAKQQRYIAKTIKSARIMGLLPFVSKEKGFFR
uniref:ribosomal protein S18 n=1 Tax=Chlorococcum tatrense TaxID=915274 RepID=UPI0010C3592A|nr:ribosomal protein S18 [Chlorococcum tatrense]AYQ94323.1 ribosomal protein S18 [Chlorococcum tatrense]